MLPVQIHLRHFNLVNLIHLSIVAVFFSSPTPTPPYYELPENEKGYTLFIDGSYHFVGIHRKWKGDVWSPTWRVTEDIEGQGG